MTHIAFSTTIGHIVARPETYVEFVNYRTEDIKYASAALVYNFAKYSGVFGTRQWMSAILVLSEIVREQKPQRFTLRAEGLSLAFSGFSFPIPYIENSVVIYRAREPRFVIEDQGALVLPRKRASIERAIREISSEMERVFKLESMERPQTLIFPRGEYAREIVVYRASQIQTG